MSTALEREASPRSPRIASTSQIEIVTDRAGIAGLKHEWDSLAPPALSAPWLTSHWATCCDSAFSDSEAPRIITLRRRGRLVGIAPLALKRSVQPLRPLRLDFLGAEELKEPNGLIYADEDALDDLAQSIAAERSLPIRLSRVPAEPSVVQRLSQAFRRRGWLVKIMRMPYPYLELSPGTNPLKKSLREDLRRARRKAEALSEVRCEMASADSGAELQRALEAAFEIEASGWKGVNETAIRCNATRSHFFRLLATACAPEHTLRLAFLRVGEQLVASQYAIESGNQYWLLNVGYRGDVRQLSPGNLLLEESIKKAMDNGLSRYNFLGKETEWTRRWTNGVQDCLVFAAYRPNLLGARAALSDALYLLEKRRKDRLVAASKSVAKD